MSASVQTCNKLRVVASHALFFPEQAMNFYETRVLMPNEFVSSWHTWNLESMVSPGVHLESMVSLSIPHTLLQHSVAHLCVQDLSMTLQIIVKLANRLINLELPCCIDACIQLLGMYSKCQMSVSIIMFLHATIEIKKHSTMQYVRMSCVNIKNSFHTIIIIITPSRVAPIR